MWLLIIKIIDNLSNTAFFSIEKVLRDLFIKGLIFQMLRLVTV